MNLHHRISATLFLTECFYRVWDMLWFLSLGHAMVSGLWGYTILARGRCKRFFVIPEMNTIRWGGGGGTARAKIASRPTLYTHMHAISSSSIARCVRFRGRGSEYEISDVRFRDDSTLLRRPLRPPCTGTNYAAPRNICCNFLHNYCKSTFFVTSMVCINMQNN